MPKAKKDRQSKQFRHDPLEKQIRESESTGSLKAPKASAGDADDVDVSKDEFVSERMSKKILEAARSQQLEVSAEASSAAAVARSVCSSRSALAALSARGMKKPLGGSERRPASSVSGAADDDDNSEDGLSEIADSDYDDEAEVVDIDEADERVLSMFMPAASSSQQRTLADLIMAKIREKEEVGVTSSSSFSSSSADAPAATAAAEQQEMVARQLDPKVVTVYTQVGQVLHKWTSGKVPKAFKIIPALKNWEEILFLTDPPRWSANAMYAATKLFASNMNPKLAQRFFNLVLLPAVREDIGRNKRLNFHYFMALKKSVFKPAAFFKGILLPLVQDGCTAREAVVLSSLLAKVSLPVEHAGVAIIKLCQMPYTGTSSLFLKTLLNKKYSLPLSVVAQVVHHLCSFQHEQRTLPVAWHQTFLVFAQRYKLSITAEQKEQLKVLLRSQCHHQIASEIRRELFGAAKHADRATETGAGEMLLE